VFENGLLRRIFDPKREEVVGGWRRLYNEELHNLYLRDAYEILAGKPEGRDHSEDPGVDRRIILEWILGKQSWKVWTGFIWLRIGISDGLL
jgi:hypothetical protein